MTFEVGKIYEIIDKTCAHEFEIGEKVRYLGYGEFCHKFEHLDKSDFWWVTPVDIGEVK